MTQIRTIEIKSKQDGFRRCGVAHSAAPTWYAEGAFSPAQWAELKNEPMLLLNVVPEALETEPPLADATDGDAEKKRASQILSATRPAKLRKDLDRMGVTYPKKSTKKALVELLLANSAQVPSNPNEED